MIEKRFHQSFVVIFTWQTTCSESISVRILILFFPVKLQTSKWKKQMKEDMEKRSREKINKCWEMRFLFCEFLWLRSSRGIIRRGRREGDEISRSIGLFGGRMILFLLARVYNLIKEKLSQLSESRIRIHISS